MQELDNSWGQQNRDLLIELKTEMAGVRQDIRDLKDNTAVRIAEHETRLNALETSRTKQNTMTSIAAGILTLLVSLLTWHLFQK